MRGHVVLVGLGAVGTHVLEGLLEHGAEVVVVERRRAPAASAPRRALGVPVVLGDATLGETLESVNLHAAAGVAILTSDDLTNIETGLAVRERLGERWTEVPVVLRVFDRQLGHRLEQSFGFRHVWSTSAIAAPWFVGAALGMEVLFTFYVGNHPFLLARLRVSEGGGLDGLAMRELPADIRVVAIRRAESPDSLEHPPRRDTRLAPGDDAFLAGPSVELLELLRHDRSAGEAGPQRPPPSRRAEGRSRRARRSSRPAARSSGSGGRAARPRAAPSPGSRPARGPPGGDVALHRAAQRGVGVLQLLDRRLADRRRRPSARPAAPPPPSRPTRSARSAGVERISPSSLS